MNHIARFAILALVCSAAYAAKDLRQHPSPSGAFTLVNVGNSAQSDHHFQLRSSDGRVLFSSDARPPLEAGSFATSVLWSPDSRFVAFSVGTSGPYIRDTFVYSTRTDALLRLPTEDSDYQTTPIRWRDARTLLVRTSAPYGGKANEESARAFYEYLRTIRLSDSPLRQETLNTSKRIHPNQ